MLGIVVLQELTGLTKGLLALAAVIRKVRRSSLLWLPVRAVRQSRGIGQIGTHASLLLSKLVDGIAGFLTAATATAVATFHVLDRVGPRAEARVATNGTRHRARTVDLHVHI